MQVIVPSTNRSTHFVREKDNTVGAVVIGVTKWYVGGKVGGSWDVGICNDQGRNCPTTPHRPASCFSSVRDVVCGGGYGLGTGTMTYMTLVPGQN